MRTLADDLLEGSIDLHAHIYPQTSLGESGRLLDHEWARAARDVGMRGFVMKSHYWPTIGQARILNETNPNLTALGSIVLNGHVGGFCPFTAESAIKLGVKIIWMPTFSAANDIKVQSYSKRVKQNFVHTPPGNGLEVWDGNGAILPEVVSILELARDADVAIATGHISAAESVALARKASEVGLKKFIFTHPIINIVEASEAQLMVVAALGYIIEFTWISAFPMWQGLDPKTVVATAKAIGANRCIMSTDAQNDFNPTAPEMLRMFIATMLQLGVDKEDIEWMVKRNPARLVNLEG
jgi:predicted TIM-barrel fold metal-dependent hydrolase